MRLNYRKITKYDKEYLELLYYETIFVLNDQPLPERSIINDQIHQKYITPWTDNDIGYIAMDPITEEAVGAVWLRFFNDDNPGNAYISPKLPELIVVVDDFFRDDGIGTDLVHYLMAQLPSSINGISLGIDIRNPALEFFERLGFTPFRIDKTIAIMRYDRH